VHGWLSFVTDVSPGVALMLVGFLAALSSYLILRGPGHGRARSAIAYLSGLGAGVAVTGVLAIAIHSAANVDGILQAGLFSSFFCPFLGMARATWDGSRRKPRRFPIARNS